MSADIEELNRILIKGLKDEVTDDLIKYAKKKLFLSKTIIEKANSPLDPVDISITISDIKRYKTFVDTYLNDKRSMNIYALFNRFDKPIQTRNNIITSKYEHVKTLNSILYNLLNDIILMSNINENVTTYKGNIRPRLMSVLNVDHANNLKKIIKHTYPRLSLESIDQEIQNNMKKVLPFSLENQNIIYKYYLCKIYNKVKLIPRKMFESIIDTILSNITVSLDIIKTNNEIEKYKEKKAITDTFKQLDDESRNVEFLMKENKLGKWSIGLSKAIYKYDASEYKGEMDPMEEETENDDYVEDEE